MLRLLGTFLSNHKSRHRGQASVELVLVLPLLLVVTVAVCQVALGLNSYLVITGASREGARKGAETCNIEAAKAEVRKACAGLHGEEPRISVAFPRGRVKGSPIEVTVTYDMPLVIPAVSRLVPDVTFSRTTSMALERGP